MPNALIGHTGFVGSNLEKQWEFDDTYHSKNIEDIAGRSYDLIACAGAPAAKWIANSQPEADWENLQRLMRALDGVQCEQFVLISSVDVYAAPRGVDEDTPIDPDKLEPYGKHRFLLEEYVREQFPNHLIVRLPGLFGEGLKKNLIFDLLTKGSSEWTHKDSAFQFYNLASLGDDLDIAQRAGLKTVNFATEPVSTQRVAKLCFGIDFENITEKPPVHYDVQTRYGELFYGEERYLYSAEGSLNEIGDFVQRQSAP